MAELVQGPAAFDGRDTEPASVPALEHEGGSTAEPRVAKLLDPHVSQLLVRKLLAGSADLPRRAVKTNRAAREVEPARVKRTTVFAPDDDVAHRRIIVYLEAGRLRSRPSRVCGKSTCRLRPGRIPTRLPFAILRRGLARV